ncbi:MAG: VWA domain-containing protein [Lewinellaceae bacterium]|nr:VWA domain-containing protein [Lewinellaceae bacterium]
MKNTKDLRPGLLLGALLFTLLLSPQPAQLYGQILNPFPCNTSDLLPPACRNVCYNLAFQFAGSSATNWTDNIPSSIGLSVNSSGVLTGVVSNTAPEGEFTFTVSANIDGSPTPTSTPFRLNIIIDPTECVSCIPANTGKWPGEQPCLHEVAFVLDNSGSMDDPESPGGSSKWTVLGTALSGYLPILTSSANLDVDDRVGVILFSGLDATLLPVISPGDPFPDLLDVTDPPPSFPPGGGTPMGGGLQRALQNFFTGLGVDGQGKKRTIILLTDGMQNLNPMVQLGRTIELEAGRFPAGGILGPGSGHGLLPINLNTPPRNSIEIYSIGIGTDISSAGHALLNNLSTDYGSTLDMAFDMNNFLNSTIPDAVETSTPRILDIRQGIADPSVSGFQTEAFTVNDSVKSLVIQLANISQQFEDPQTFLFKDGNPVSAGPAFTNGKTILYDIDFPATDIGLPDPGSSRGEWEIRFLDHARFQYEVTAIVDETGIHHQIDFSGQDEFYAGDDLKVRVKLWDREGPITDASVVAVLQRPGDDLGDLAANTTVPGDSLSTGQPDQSSIGQAKLTYLGNQQEFWNLLQRTSNQLTLQHTGDGIYTGTFSGNSVTGTYRVIASIEGVHPNLGPYEGRESTFAFFDFARPEDITLNETIIPLGADPDGGQSYLVTILPTNRFGRKIGPGQLGRITASSSLGSVSNWKDNLDGSYEFTIRAPQNAPTDLSIFVIDKETPVLRKKINESRPFGISLHGGFLRPLNNTSPFDTLTNGFYTEIDLAYRFNPSIALQLIGGNYNFENDFQIWGGSLFLEYTFRKNVVASVFYPRIAAGIGGFKPDNQDTTFGLGLRGSLVYQVSPNIEAGLDFGLYSLPEPGYLFGYTGIGLKFYL